MLLLSSGSLSRGRPRADRALDSYNGRSAERASQHRRCDHAPVKAAVYTRYGPPDVVEICDVEKPVPNDDEVLIQIRAASVNALDWRSVSGTPLVARAAMGLGKPKFTRLGVDVAGVVEAVGRNITQFKPGDAVFGNARGAFAEYACAAESTLFMKPESMTFAQAACVPVAAFTALQGLRKGKIRPGQKILINGAGGGVGTFAVQIAKSFGADVTGVSSTKNAELVRSIGADRFVDYTQEDFTQRAERYDLILDCHATHGLLACRRVLNPNGTYVAVGAPFVRSSDVLLLAIKCLALSWFGGRKLGMLLARKNKEDLATLIDLVKDGKVTPVIDRRYRLSEIREALTYVQQGHARGKVIIILADDET